MNRLLRVTAAAAVAAILSADAAEGEAGARESAASSFCGWRVSAGGAMGFGLKTKMRFAVPGRVYLGPSSPAAGSPAAIKDALDGGQRVSFLDGAYIDPESDMSSPYTQNWRFPEAAVDRSTGSVSLQSAQFADGGMSGCGSDTEAAFGASAELARTLYAHEDGFGVDLALGFAWMRRNNCFKAHAAGTYVDRSSYVYTPTSGSMNEAVLTSPGLSPSGGYYGAGVASGMGPVLDWSDFGPGTLSQTSSSGSYSLCGEGDYEEWDLRVMFKPWWAVTDWFLLTGTIGMGVSRGKFEYEVSGRFDATGGYSSHRTVDKWDCYGVAGGGVAFRLWQVELSCDVLARFLQDDLKVHSEAMSGRIEKPDLLVLVALGYAF